MSYPKYFLYALVTSEWRNLNALNKPALMYVSCLSYLHIYQRNRRPLLSQEWASLGWNAACLLSLWKVNQRKYISFAFAEIHTHYTFHTKDYSNRWNFHLINSPYPRVTYLKHLRLYVYMLIELVYVLCLITIYLNNLKIWLDLRIYCAMRYEDSFFHTSCGNLMLWRLGHYPTTFKE